MPGVLHHLQAKPDRIELMGFAACAYTAKDFLYLGTALCEVGQDIRVVGIGHDEDLVLGRQGHRNFAGGLQGLLHFVLHASADIHQNPQTQWNTLVMGKEGEVLFYAVLEDRKVLSIQILDVPARQIQNRGCHVDQRNFDP